ncbi:MAG: hypothetical protein AAFX87_13605 [Bacteroidota bacterium]
MIEQIVSKNSKILYDAKHNIMGMVFIGDIKDEAYKEIWLNALNVASEHNVKRILIDQRQIGNVSFSARGWVMVSMFPKIKKQLGANLHGAILASKNMVHKSGVQFLVKAFQKVSGFNIQFFNDQEGGVQWLATTEV